MEKNELIAIEICSTHYGIEISFIRSLAGAGLLEIVHVHNLDYVYSSQMAHLEKMVRLHQELDINLEGVEAIGHLLHRVDRLQEEIRLLRNRLSLYE